MQWYPDLPELPIRKPQQIEDLELMSQINLDSMPAVEIQEKVDEIAHAVASGYKQQIVNGSREECQAVVSIALTSTGSAIGGRMGNELIAQSHRTSQEAALVAYPELHIY